MIHWIDLPCPSTVLGLPSWLSSKNPSPNIRGELVPRFGWSPGVWNGNHLYSALWEVLKEEPCGLQSMWVTKNWHDLTTEKQGSSSLILISSSPQLYPPLFPILIHPLPTWHLLGNGKPLLFSHLVICDPMTAIMGSLSFTHLLNLSFSDSSFIESSDAI